MRIENKLNAWVKFIVKIFPFISLLILSWLIPKSADITLVSFISELNGNLPFGFINTALTGFIGFFVTNLSVIGQVVIDYISYLIIIDLLFFVYDLLTYFIFISEKFIRRD